MKKFLVLCLVLFLVVPLQAASTVGIPEGKGQVTVGQGERAIQVYTYKPKGFSNGPIFFVFHGAKRNAEDYRNWTISLAEKYHAIVAAPFFDQDRFLAHLYSWGGILSKDGKLRDSSKWSFPLATEVIQSILKGEGDRKRDHYLLGHSGDGIGHGQKSDCRECGNIPISPTGLGLGLRIWKVAQGSSEG